MATLCIIYRPARWKPELPPSTTLRPAEELLDPTQRCSDPAVLIVDVPLLVQIDGDRIPTHAAVVALDEDADEALGDRADLSLAHVTDPMMEQRTLRAACRLAVARAAAARFRRDRTCTRHDLHKLNQTGIDLMHERDLDSLLRRIVERGQRLTESDAGCLFLLEADAAGAPVLRLAVYANASRPEMRVLASSDQVAPLPLDHSSIIGHAAATRRPLMIDDAYALPPSAGFTSNIDFELRHGYYVQSMLVVPMLDRQDALVGVLAFVNRKRERGARITDRDSARRHAIPYRRRQLRMVRALAGFAAVSIENSRLYQRIEDTLESLAAAAVSAIDQRDPSTAGHSLRVATLTTELANAVQRGGGGAYRDLRFSAAQMRELHFAALLHDLGKVTVRENILLKGKRLPPELWERVQSRFVVLLRMTPQDQRAEIERAWRTVRAANDPWAGADAAELDAIARRQLPGQDGSPVFLLTAEELHYLRIPRGTLDEHERLEIQSHVEMTYQFLLQIPWTDDLRNVPAYARGHHEKLDGSGYPRRLRGDEIPVQTRLMTIADIFDALTAADRPYKSALPVDRALAVLKSEAEAGMLDGELVRVLLESRVYEAILPATRT